MSEAVNFTNGIMEFVSDDTRISVLELLEKMSPEEYLDFCEEHNFNSIYYLEHLALEDKSIDMAQFVEDNSHIFTSFSEGIIPITPFSKISNENGFFISNSLLTYRNKENIYFKAVNDESVYNYSVEDIMNNYDKIYTFENQIDLRWCNTKDWDKEIYYDDGDKRLRVHLGHWVHWTPGYFGGYWGGPDRQEYGWEMQNWSEDDNWLKGWHGEDAAVFAKIDAYMTYDPDKIWVWKTCSSCNKISHTQLTQTYIGSVYGGGGLLEQYWDPLIWYIAQLEDKQDESLRFNSRNNYTSNPSHQDCDGFGSGDHENEDLNPEICWNCY